MARRRRGPGGRFALVSLHPSRRLHRPASAGQSALRLRAARGARHRDDADHDARVEPVGVHVRVSAGGGGHRSSRADLHPHRGDALRRPPDHRHRIRTGARGRLEAGSGPHDVRPGRRPYQPRSRLEGRPPRVRLDDPVEADVRQDGDRRGRRSRRRLVSRRSTAARPRRRSIAARTSSSFRCRRGRP